MVKPRISVLINTLEEEANVGFAIRSVRKWADEVIVVDMHSADRTAEIARELGASVHLHERLEYVEPARAFGFAKCSGEWILMLDADEVIEPDLARRLREIADRDEADVVTPAYETFVMGKPIRTTHYRSRYSSQRRFFKKSVVSTTQFIHGGLAFAEGARALRLPYRPGLCLLHFAVLDFDELTDKFNRYTTIEAHEHVRQVRPGVAFWVYVRVFIRNHFRLGGLRGGWRAFYLTMFTIMYRMSVHAKQTQLADVGDRERVRAIHAAEAERVVSQYED